MTKRIICSLLSLGLCLAAIPLVDAVTVCHDYTIHRVSGGRENPNHSGPEVVVNR